MNSSSSIAILGLALLAALPAGCASSGPANQTRAAAPRNANEALVYVHGVT